MKMNKSIVVALVVSLALPLAAGMAGAGVARTATIGVAVEELKTVALVVDHTDYDGYRRLSLRRALAVVNRPLMVAVAAFRPASQALMLR